ncbi:MAG: STAS domain-containing protein [Planctomycetota bacterium]|nr:STAS domain-containing protein [Planctomycetota bacterium]
MADEQVVPPPANGTRKLNGSRQETGVIRDYIAVARGSDLVVIRVVGKGSMLTAPALAEFADQQRQAGFRRFVFDLERCRGLDSTFMGVMVGTQTALRSDSAIQPVPEGARALENKPAEAEAVEAMSPAEAVAALRELLAKPAAAVADAPAPEKAVSVARPPPPWKAGDGSVSAVNVPKEIADLMTVLGADKFVKVRGTYDLRQLETTILPEKNLPPDEQHRLILKAHDTLIEIDKRNEARFGPFLKSLSQALATGQ